MSIFETLNKINVNERTEKKNNLTYLPWAWAWGTLKGIYFVVALCGAIGNFLPAVMYALDRFTGRRRDEILQELDVMRQQRIAAETLETVG